MAQKEAARNPPPPYITATLQQDASARAGLSPSAAMRLAQQLYEGSEAPGGARESFFLSLPFLCAVQGPAVRGLFPLLLIFYLFFELDLGEAGPCKRAPLPMAHGRAARAACEHPR